VNLFDVYEGKNLADGMKSYALSFYLQDAQQTLTDKHIEKSMQQILQALEKDCGAKLRM
jgi:phenylalanyl-tRNA synthetase beta chain